MLAKKALSASASAPEALYVEDVASVYLYTGNGSSQTITNNIDLSGKGGLVWLKRRDGTNPHLLFDTARGKGNSLSSNTTDAQTGLDYYTQNFTSTGFTLGSNFDTNTNNATYASFTFRKQPKFFDVVTYTGNGTSGRTVSHNLGSTPGMIIVKRLNTAATWAVYHRSIGATNYLALNDTMESTTNSGIWNNTAPTSTQFTVGNLGAVNGNGDTYVAYLFAHDAGGFGAAGTDNIISCGSATISSGFTNIDLGYEPQFILWKNTTSVQNWRMFDNMRGLTASNGSALFPNLSNAESTEDGVRITATGFQVDGTFYGAQTLVYMAIRRPMKTPTTGTGVFSPVISTGTNNTTTGNFVTAGFPVDLSILQFRNQAFGTAVVDRLRGIGQTGLQNSTRVLYTYTNDVEAPGSEQFNADNMTGLRNYGYPTTWNMVNWMFRRAPGFFDEVCYTGTGSARTVAHNLGVAPELMIVKQRSSSNIDGWVVYGNSVSTTLLLQSNASSYNGGSGNWNSTAPTASVFSLGTNAAVNGNGITCVAYLFASCPGVSKVFSYTGNGSSQTINCGFSGGARLVLIKRTDSTGDWYIWDSSRGIVSGNDPRLSLNSTAAEVTSDDTIDPDSSGFVVNQVSATNVNVSSATYIGLAIA